MYSQSRILLSGSFLKLFSELFKGFRSEKPNLLVKIFIKRSFYVIIQKSLSPYLTTNTATIMK